jgi:hypothetical protein
VSRRAELDVGTMRMLGARSVLNKPLQIGAQVKQTLRDSDDIDAMDDSRDVETVDLSDLREEIQLLLRALEWNE